MELSRNFEKAGMRQTIEYSKLATALLCLALVALPGADARSVYPADPTLTGGKPGPCQPNLKSPAYVGGVDTRGNRIAPADLNGAGVDLGSVSAAPILEPARSRHRISVVVLGAKHAEITQDCVPAKHGRTGNDRPRSR